MKFISRFDYHLIWGGVSDLKVTFCVLCVLAIIINPFVPLFLWDNPSAITLCYNIDKELKTCEYRPWKYPFICKFHSLGFVYKKDTIPHVYRKRHIKTHQDTSRYNKTDHYTAISEHTQYTTIFYIITFELLNTTQKILIHPQISNSMYDMDYL